MTWQPHVTVAVVVEREGRFLLVEEMTPGNDQPVLNQPAGHVERGETLVQAACREALEETGWHVEPTAFLGLYTYTPPTDPDCTYYRACFIAQTLKHEGRSLDTGIIRAVWLTPDELESSGRARSPLVIRCVRDYLEGRSLPLSAIYEHGFA